jgi:hypothetical protein
MNIQLINGEFNSTEAVELITQMVNVKIKYHENKIITQDNEEDIKLRETKIKQLQNELQKLKIDSKGKYDNLKLEAKIELENWPN